MWIDKSSLRIPNRCSFFYHPLHFYPPHFLPSLYTLFADFWNPHPDHQVLGLMESNFCGENRGARFNHLHPSNITPFPFSLVELPQGVSLGIFSYSIIPRFYKNSLTTHWMEWSKGQLQREWKKCSFAQISSNFHQKWGKFTLLYSFRSYKALKLLYSEIKFVF